MLIENSTRQFNLAAYGGENELALVGPNIRLTSRQLFQSGGDLALAIEKAGINRLVLVSQSAVVISTALIAAQLSGIDIVLVRHAGEYLETEVSGWGANGQLHPDLSITRIETQNNVIPSRKLIVTTSGTTGKPKAVIYSFGHLIGRIKPPPPGSSRAKWLLTYNPASFAGLQVILTALISGATLCFPLNYDVEGIAGAAEKLLPTHISGTPTFWRSLLLTMRDRSEKLPLKRITLGGEVADQSILDRLSKKFPRAGISHIYASTEAGAVFTVKDRCAGLPTNWLESGVDGVQLRINDQSVLEVYAKCGMEGYAGSGEILKKWIVTGDVVRIEGDRVFFVGREDAVINVGGAKVWPESVEGVLCCDPGIAEAYVYGKRNPILGALVMADVVIECGYDESEVIAAAKRSLIVKLPRYAVPQRITPVSSITTSDASKKVRNK